MCKYFSRVDTQKCNSWVIGYAHFLFLCPFKILIDPAKFPSKVAVQIYSLSAVHENSPHSHQLQNFFFFFSNLMCKKWLLVAFPCNLLVSGEFGFIFPTPVSAGTCSGPSSSAGLGQGSASCTGRVPGRGTSRAEPSVFATVTQASD